MKDIRIKRLVLENFKCHSHLKIGFNGRNTSLLGDNATGKTSVYDSLMWLLFSCDSHGNGEKNIEIKPLGEGGKVKDHNAITEVEAVLLVDGEEISLRRTLQEVWTTRRGSSEAVYSGNVSEYYIDGVPVKKTAFSEKVDEIVSEDTFKLLTNISYFSNDLSWQERRAVLFRVAGVMDDAQILATDERFEPLIKSMGRLSVEDYKKKLLSEKKGFVGAKNELPARISECEKTIEDVEGLDFDKARAEVEALNDRRAELESQIVAIEHDTACDMKRVEIKEARLALDGIEAENRAYRAAQTASAPNIAEMESGLARLLAQLSRKKAQLANELDLISKLERGIAASRERWMHVNGEVFTEGSCPTCGQALPGAQLRAAEESFEAGKKKRLREIEETANANKVSKTAAEERAESLKCEIADLEKEIAEAEGRINVAKNYVVTPAHMDGYAERRAGAEEKIRILEGELADMVMNTSAVKEQLRGRISVLTADAERYREIISKESLLEYSRKRIEELREDARNSAACLEAIEGMLYLMDEYSRYKTKFVEDSINGLFRIARFRLFREQANGGVEDRCDVVYEGVPYINVNNGAKINLGIDIINTLSRAYGVTVPLFVDNAESVTRLEESCGQVIRLAVSKNDKELRVEYEN